MKFVNPVSGKEFNADKSQVEILKAAGYLTVEEYADKKSAGSESGGEDDGKDGGGESDENESETEESKTTESKEDKNVGFVEITPEEFKKLPHAEKEAYIKAKNAALNSIKA